jgi:formate dehydrogenase maturation protein FdhE
MTKQCKCGSKDVAVIHDFMKKGIDAMQCTKCCSRWTVGFGKDVRDIKIQCKKCGQSIETPPKLLEHIVLVHEDKKAGELLSRLNQLSGRGT